MMASFGHVRRQRSTLIVFWNCGQVGEPGSCPLTEITHGLRPAEMFYFFTGSELSYAPMKLADPKGVAPWWPCANTLPADNGLLRWLSYGSGNWWEVLVTLQFVASGFVLRHPIYSVFSCPTWRLNSRFGASELTSRDHTTA